MSDDFYIGYQKVMPPHLAGFLRTRIAVLALVVVVLAGVMAAVQHPFAGSNFEFGVVKTFTGIVHESPYPALTLDHPVGSDKPFSRFHLVAPGKHGAQKLVAGFDGKLINVKGSLIYRDNQTMIEIQPDSLEELSTAAFEPGRIENLGMFTLQGEIVDSKCYLGVMKPGNLKPHKSCAIRCISGGITPVLCVRDEEGHAVYVVLAGADGRQINADVIPFVAEPVEITGRVERRDDMLIMTIDPAKIIRL